MKSKLFNIVKDIFIIIISGIGGYYFYTKLVEVHTNFCCEGIDNCPLYLCSSNSSELTKYSVYATITVFCVVLFILFIIGLISTLLKEEK